MKKIILNIKLKHILLLAAIIYVTENTYAQKERKNYTGVSYSFGWSDYSRNGTTVGGFGTSHSYGGNDFKSTSVDYARQTSSNVEFCTGFTVIAAYVATASTYYSINGGGSSNTTNYREALVILSLPLHLRRHLSKYLFMEGGLNLNYHPNMGYKYGAGLSGSIGAEYIFHSGITFFASSFVQCNLMMGASHETDMGSAGTYVMSSPDKLLQLGIKLGVGYKF
jgi:hypothetical protein